MLAHVSFEACLEDSEVMDFSVELDELDFLAADHVFDEIHVGLNELVFFHSTRFLKGQFIGLQLRRFCGGLLRRHRWGFWTCKERIRLEQVVFNGLARLLSYSR